MSQDQPQSPQGKVWYLLPDAKIVEEGDKGSGAAVAFCFEGDGSKGLPWRPIHELAGYRKPEAPTPERGRPKKSSSQGKFPNRNY